MSSRPVYQTCAQVAPSGECLRGYKPGAADCSRLASRMAAFCLAKPSAPVLVEWQLLCVCMHYIELHSCKCVYNKLTLLYLLTLTVLA